MWQSTITPTLLSALKGMEKRKVIFSIALLVIIFGMYTWIRGLNHHERGEESALLSSNHPKHNSDSIPLFDSNTQILRGNHRCNSYVRKFDNDEMFSSASDNLMSSCKIQNICLTSNGEFILFQDEERINGGKYRIDLLLNRIPWVYAQGAAEGTSKRGFFHVKVDGSDLIIQKKDDGSKTMFKMNKILENNSSGGDITYGYEHVEFSKDFEIVEKPVYAMYRYAVGFLSHGLLHNIQKVILSMMSYMPTHDGNLEKLLDNQILYLDDIYDEEDDNWMGAYHGDKKVATDMSIQLASLVSKNPPLQLCHSSDSYSISKVPCKNVKFTKKEDNIVLKKCFSEFYIGYSFPLFIRLYGREMIAVYMRQIVYLNLNIFPLPNEENIPQVYNPFMSKKNIVIAIQKPSRIDHGISNVEELKQYVETNLAKQAFITNLGKKIEVSIVDLNSNHHISESVKFMSTVDVFITDTGMSSTFALFLRDDTTTLLSPKCSTQTKCTQTDNIIDALTNTNVVNLYRDGMTCTERSTMLNADNCDAILSTEIVFDHVVKALKLRYRNLIF